MEQVVAYYKVGNRKIKNTDQNSPGTKPRPPEHEAEGVRIQK